MVRAGLILLSNKSYIMRKLIDYSSVLILLSGCMTTGKVAYIQDVRQKKDLGNEFVNEQQRTLIQVCDELYVSISSFN